MGQACELMNRLRSNEVSSMKPPTDPVFSSLHSSIIFMYIPNKRVGICKVAWRGAIYRPMWREHQSDASQRTYLHQEHGEFRMMIPYCDYCHTWRVCDMGVSGRENNRCAQSIATLHCVPLYARLEDAGNKTD